MSRSLSVTVAFISFSTQASFCLGSITSLIVSETLLYDQDDAVITSLISCFEPILVNG